LLSESEKHINLLGLSLPTFALESKVEFLRHKLNEGVHVRILLLNPFSPTAIQRPDKIYELATNVIESSINTLTILLKLFKKGLTDKAKRNLDIGVININPCISIIGNEKKILWSPYLSSSTGAKSPFLIHDLSSSKFGFEIQKHFEELIRNYALIINNNTTISILVSFVENEGFKPNDIDIQLVKKLENALEAK